MRHYKDSSNHPQVQTLVRNDYTYNPAGIRVSNQIRSQGLNTDGTPVVDASGNPVFTGRTEVYGYDNSNQLTSVDYGDGQAQSYSFVSKPDAYWRCYTLFASSELQRG